MNKSDSITKLASALLKAQKEMGGAIKGASNSFYKSKYSDYNSVLEVVKEPLNNAGVILLQPTVTREGRTILETTLVHAESGEFLSGEMDIICAKQNDPQAYGSAITYARRYALQSMLSIPSEDSDAEGAMNRTSKPSTVANTPVATTSAINLGSGATTSPPAAASWRKPKPVAAPNGDAKLIAAAIAVGNEY